MTVFVIFARAISAIKKKIVRGFFYWNVNAKKKNILFKFRDTERTELV